MNILFEISDKTLIIIGVIIVLLIAIGIILFRVLTRKKIKPIEEEERYDAEPLEDDYGSLSIEEFFEEEREIPKEELTEEQIEAKEELQRVFSKMSEDLNKEITPKDVIDDFEKRQEEDAIISYQELVKRAGELKEDAYNYEHDSELNANMSVSDIMDSYSKREKTYDKESKKFKNSDIISPIYGIQSNKDMIKLKKRKQNDKKSDIISKAYKEEFDEEKTQNLEFLKSLREFRKNL